MTFFLASRRFTKWLVRYAAGRHIADVGAGDGDLAARLTRAGAQVMEIDPHAEARPGLIPLHVHRVGVVRTEPMLLIVARPDHGGWVRGIAGYMHPESELLYLGLERNVQLDLGDLQCERLDPPMCSSYQVALSIRRQEVVGDMYERNIDSLLRPTTRRLERFHADKATSQAGPTGPSE